jgi:hypothetical protein
MIGKKERQEVCVELNDYLDKIAEGLFPFFERAKRIDFVDKFKYVVAKYQTHAAL